MLRRGGRGGIGCREVHYWCYAAAYSMAIEAHFTREIAYRLEWAGQSRDLENAIVTSGISPRFRVV
jgi:hypothetical protein